MDTSAAFAEALIPAKHTVAGIALQPFAIGHGLLLQKRGSPIVSYWTDVPTEKMQLGDMALTLWVCSRSATQAMHQLGGWRMRWRIRSIAKAILRHGLLRTETQLMRYVASGFAAPRMRLQGDSKKIGSPLLAVLHVTMMRHFGCNMAEALNTPISLAYWQRCILLDEKGYAQIWTREDYEFQEYSEDLARNPEKLDALFSAQNEEGGRDGK